MSGGGRQTPPPFISLVSLRHSGTHFVISLLGLPRYRFKNWRGQPGIVHCHLDGMDCLDKVNIEWPVIIPLRRPEAMAKSNMARYGHVDYLRDGLTQLMAFKDVANPLWLPIDAPRRGYWLSRLGAAIGMKLRTDWPVVDSRSPAYDGPVPDIGHKDFFEQFYAA